MSAREWVALLGIIGLDGVCYAGIRFGLQYASPVAFGGLRALMAGAVLLVWAAISRTPVVPHRRDWLSLALLGLVATTATYGTMFNSPTQMGTGLASLLGNVQPLFVVLLGALFLDERLTARKLLALALGSAGVVLVLWPSISAPLSAGGTGIRATGTLLALGTSLAVAVASIIVKRLHVRPGLPAKTGWQLVIGSVPLVVAAVARPGVEIEWNVRFAGVLVFLALFGTALSTTLWFWLLQRHEAGRLSIFLFLIPVIGLGVGAFGFGERIDMLQGLGVVVIVAGLVIVARGQYGRATSGVQRSSIGAVS